MQIVNTMLRIPSPLILESVYYIGRQSRIIKAVTIGRKGAGAMKLKIKYRDKDYPRLQKIARGDWIDLRVKGCGTTGYD